MQMTLGAKKRVGSIFYHVGTCMFDIGDATQYLYSINIFIFIFSVGIYTSTSIINKLTITIEKNTTS